MRIVLLHYVVITYDIYMFVTFNDRNLRLKCIYSIVLGLQNNYYVQFTLSTQHYAGQGPRRSLVK